MSSDIWTKKEKILTNLGERNPDCNRKSKDKRDLKRAFYHYTSLPVLFDILENDSLWASNLRFSNDKMEARILKIKESIFRDDYMICFCNEKDKLSQWRGYCYEGGAAIEFALRLPRKYSILYSDYEVSKKYTVLENVPLRVVYVSEEDIGNQDIVQRTIDSTDKSISVEDILPYLKNEKFYEEKEHRLVFSNIKGNLSKCIRFRTLSNGVKVPYMVIKSGDVGKMYRNCTTDVNQYTDEMLKEMEKDRPEIWIEEGENQEAVYNEIIERIHNFEKKEEIKSGIRVYCKGHLPIKSIIVAPTADREIVAEQIERFCRSKYWLREIKIEESTIPYIRPQK